MTPCPYPDAKSKHQAVRDTLDSISGKWKFDILALLLQRTYRFKELSREIGISPRILAKELREMEVNHLVKRTVRDTRPVTVEYEGTAHSRTLLPLFQNMCDWGYRHHEEVVGSRRPGDPALAAESPAVVCQPLGNQEG